MHKVIGNRIIIIIIIIIIITMKHLCLSLRVYIAWLNVIQKDHKSNEINSYHELLAFGERAKPENSGEELSEKSRV